MVLTQLIFAQTKNMIITNLDGSRFCYTISDIDSIIFTTDMGCITDIDGNTYITVKIGNQWWMAENLRVSRYRNGVEIPEEKVTDQNNFSDIEYGARCYYDNDSTTYHNTYGCLYNGYAVYDSRNIAPEGWHVPTIEEYQELIDYLGGSLVANKKLKSKSG